MGELELRLRPILKEAALDSCGLLLEQPSGPAWCLDFEMHAEGPRYRLTFRIREIGKVGEVLVVGDDREEASSGPLTAIGAPQLRVVARPAPDRTWRSLSHAGQIDFALRRSTVFSQPNHPTDS